MADPNSRSHRGSGGTPGPADLLPLVYDELRALAAPYLAAESPGHTLQPTASSTKRTSGSTSAVGLTTRPPPARRSGGYSSTTPGRSGPASAVETPAGWPSTPTNFLAVRFDMDERSYLRYQRPLGAGTGASGPALRASPLPTTTHEFCRRPRKTCICFPPRGL
jgi:hypothetical protein